MSTEHPTTNGPVATWPLGEWTLALRPIREDDGPLWLEFVRAMSWATRYKRGSRRAEDLSPEDVRRAVMPDPDNEIAFVVVVNRENETRMVGVSRARRMRPDAWEFGIVVLDDWQKAGIGLKLMRALMDALGRCHAERIEGEVLASNKTMLEFLGRLGFERHTHQANPHLVRVTRKLAPATAAARLSAGEEAD